MAFVALLDDAEDSIDVCWQNADGFGLAEYVFDGVSVEDFGHPQEAFLELGVKHLTCIYGDKGADVWVDLRDNESVHIEELCETLHGKV